MSRNIQYKVNEITNNYYTNIYIYIYTYTLQYIYIFLYKIINR